MASGGDDDPSGLETLCADELQYLGADALNVLAKTSRELRLTAMRSFSGGSDDGNATTPDATISRSRSRRTS